MLEIYRPPLVEGSLRCLVGSAVLWCGWFFWLTSGQLVQQLLLLVEAGCLGRFLLGAATFSHLIIAAACNGHVDLPVRPFRPIRHAFLTLQHYCFEASGLLTQGGSEYTVSLGVPLKRPVVRCRPRCTEACFERWRGLYCDIKAMKEGVSSG